MARPRLDLKLRVETNSVPVPEAGCWLWLGHAIKGTGYGAARVGRTQHMSAHRMSYTAYKGVIPRGKVVRHKCDTRLCCNPDHLELGTQKQNVRDMYKRGRAVNVTGEQNGKCKYSDALVAEIRLCGLSTRAAAAKFGVSKSQAHSIMSGTQRRAS